MGRTESKAFKDVIRRAIWRARTEHGLEQAQLAKRMAALGHPWHPQTVSGVENGRRRVTAEELLALSLSLEVPMSSLLSPSTSDPATPVAVGDVMVIPSDVVATSAGQGRHEPWIEWVDDEPRWPDEDRRLQLEEELRAARESEATAMAEAAELQEANAVGGQIARALHSADVWHVRAGYLERRLQLLTEGPTWIYVDGQMLEVKDYLADGEGKS